MEIRRLLPDDDELLQQAVRVLRDVDELLRPKGHRMMLLYEIGVSEPHRREGVGRQLLDAFVELARSKGHAKMWLFTDAGNDAAHRLYEGAGGDRKDDAVGYWWVFE